MNERLDYPALERLLREWVSAAGHEGPYDRVGMMGLLVACLDNLRDAIPDYDEDFERFLSPQHLEYMERLIRVHRAAPEDDD